MGREEKRKTGSVQSAHFRFGVGGRSGLGCSDAGRCLDLNGLEGLVETPQVVQDIQLHGTLNAEVRIGQAFGTEDALASRVVVLVSANRFVELRNVLKSEVGAEELQLVHEFAVAAAFRSQDNLLLREAEGGRDHLVVTCAEGGITVGKLPVLVQGELGIEAGEVECAGERARSARRHLRNDFSHRLDFLLSTDVLNGKPEDGMRGGMNPLLSTLCRGAH